MENPIIQIDINQIYQHPDNPRKDLGDLEELAESIKKNGIMQNLTVVQGHFDGEKWKDDCYTLIIGHRRCAAARAAGIATVPCRVVEMEKREQVATMLEENMQRSDLTIFEQAQGFQMMLDLGETEESIATRTGFSRTTIKHRLNLAKLNSKELKKKQDDEGFQLSLKDLYELEKIPDIKMRNKILKESTSSNNLTQKIQTAVTELKRAENEKHYISLCGKKGIRPAPDDAKDARWNGDWEIIKEFYLDEKPKEILGVKADDQMFYVRWGYGRYFAIIKKKNKQKKELSPAEIKSRNREKNKKKINAILKEMAAERKEFLKLITERKVKSEFSEMDIASRLINLLLYKSVWISGFAITEFKTGKKSLYGEPEEVIHEYEEWQSKLSIVDKLLIIVEKNISESSTVEWNYTYSKSEGNRLIELETILATYGFTYSSTEYYQIADGTHEFYVKKA